ncbi:MAG: histidine phosphatase family protein [Ilumatobacteraceae bacterium]
MELLIIRHALPVRRELTEGVADPELSEDGHKQAECLARYLESEHLDALYASPLARARETAAPLAALKNLEVHISADVAEWDQNSPEYVPIEELKAANDPRWQAMLNGEWDSDESPADFEARVLAAIETIIADHRGQRVAVVCHGGIINGYLAHVLGIDSFATHFFYPNYTSIHRVAAASSGQRSVVTINETSHLRGTGLPMGLFQKG